MDEDDFGDFVSPTSGLVAGGRDQEPIKPQEKTFLIPVTQERRLESSNDDFDAFTSAAVSAVTALTTTSNDDFDAFTSAAVSAVTAPTTTSNDGFDAFTSAAEFHVPKYSRTALENDTVFKIRIVHFSIFLIIQLFFSFFAFFYFYILAVFGTRDLCYPG